MDTYLHTLLLFSQTVRVAVQTVQHSNSAAVTGGLSRPTTSISSMGHTHL